MAPVDSKNSITGDIFIVDDNPKNIALLSTVLKDYGHKVRVATDGQFALQAIESEAPDLILLDIFMPGMSGYEVLEALKSKPESREIPVIMLSALTETEGIIKAFDLGCVDYVTKPFRNEEVLVRIATQLKLLRYQQELLQTNEELLAKNETLKKTQAQLIQSEKMASLGILTAGVAHEINNPLNFIQGTYTALERIHRKNSFAVDYRKIGSLLNALKVGVERTTTIVKGLNQFSRASESVHEECNVHKIIDNCLTMLKSQLKQGIAIEKHYTSPDIRVEGNEGNLHQVFLNVLSNAVQAITCSGTVTIKTSLSSTQASIEISDTGEGISPENMEKITTPFFTTKDPGKGTGLGLSISYNIIQEHKGQLEFSSEPGTGTTVRIMLPG